jgi:glyoxylase-like metal-dependent hydrolase (beta-lactamase superfamily II)
LSDIPFVKSFPFAYGEAAAVSPLVRRVIAKNPGPYTFTGSGTYIIGREGGSLAVIDPGPDDAAHVDALVAAIGKGRVTHIFITHTHRDHCGAAAAFAERVGAPTLAFGCHPDGDGTSVEEGADRDFRPDQFIGDGATFEGDGWTIAAVATPGHLSNHLCYDLKEEAALFTGDHVMGWSTTVVAPPDGDMGDYLDSLEKLLARDDRRYYPTHGAPIDKPLPFVRAIRAHRRMRDGQILDQLMKDRAQIADMIPHMYQGLDKRLQGAAAMNILAHLIRLQRIGAVEADGPPGLRARFRLAKGGEV